jgi:hypothetical protein
MRNPPIRSAQRCYFRGQFGFARTFSAMFKCPGSETSSL